MLKEDNNTTSWADLIYDHVTSKDIRRGRSYLPLESWGYYVPTLWLRFRPYRYRAARVGGIIFVVFCVLWLLSICFSPTASIMQEVDAELIEEAQAFAEAATEPPTAAIAVVSPPQIPKEAWEITCEAVHSTPSSCGDIDWKHYSVCLYRESDGKPINYLRQPTISHRRSPMLVEEVDERCTQPRRVTRHKQITVLHKDWHDETVFVLMEDAYCLQKLIEELQRGHPSAQCA